jgi:hypothetical protein
MRPASEFDPSIIINMHGFSHVTGLLNVPSVQEVVGRSQHESSDDFVAIDSAGSPVGLLLLDRVHSWLCEMSRILVVSRWLSKSGKRPFRKPLSVRLIRGRLSSR